MQPTFSLALAWADFYILFRFSTMMFYGTAVFMTVNRAGSKCCTDAKIELFFGVTYYFDFVAFYHMGVA